MVQFFDLGGIDIPSRGIFHRFFLTTFYFTAKLF